MDFNLLHAEFSIFKFNKNIRVEIKILLNELIRGLCAEIFI
jgi:hypothetical protein